MSLTETHRKSLMPERQWRANGLRDRIRKELRSSLNSNVAISSTKAVSCTNAVSWKKKASVWTNAAFIVFAMVAAVGCTPQIGDSCTVSTDCLFNGARVCDRTLTDSGYCTIFSCEAQTCPSEAWCVQFRQEPPRTTTSWCMRGCEKDSDCRIDEGYRCIRQSDYDDQVAIILDGSDLGFCGIP